MARYKVGDAIVTIEHVRYTHDNRDEYAGDITLPDGRSWKFSELCSGVGGGEESKQAGAACSFGSYYTTHNRSDDVPSWAPPAELADAIEDATCWAQDDQGEYTVEKLP